MSKRQKQYIDKYASLNNKDFFGTVYDSMMQSKKYKNMIIGARYFYIICRVQAQSPHGTSCLYQHGKQFAREYDKKKDFVFPSKHLMLYGIDRRNADKYFKILIQNGFIEYKERNQKQKEINVYSFSEKWKDTS